MGTPAADAVLIAAQGGDEEAFVRLTAPHRDGLHRHCYRLLGSLYDADDALQETLLRAWRGLSGYAPSGPLGAWLTRIATNVCLRAIERRGREAAAVVDAHLEPYPDALLDAVAAPARGPHEVAVEREQIGLALVAAMQLLPAKQRVCVVLRDVLGWSAREVAELLEDSVPAVNSALQRGRERLERESQEGTLGRRHAPSDEAAERRVMRLFQEAWEALDVDAIVALLADDALLTMPPEDIRIHGAAQIGAFFAAVPLEGRLDRIALLPARANGQPALAAYADEEGTGHRDPYGVMVFSVEGDRIAAITGFPRRPDIFARLGLPARLGAPGGSEG